jgi:hypothetical protein
MGPFRQTQHDSIPKGRSVSPDAQLARVRLEPHVFHGEWNDTIHPTGTA